MIDETLPTRFARILSEPVVSVFGKFSHRGGRKTKSQLPEIDRHYFGGKKRPKFAILSGMVFQFATFRK
jgi:hypothetical protein